MEKTTPAASYLIQALNLYDSINIKGMRNLVSGKVIDSTPQELQVQYGDNSFLFVYRFGCLVFFNMPTALIESETSRLKETLGTGLHNPTSETYLITVGDKPINVEFEYVELKKLSIDLLRLVAMTVGQSAALEYFELQAERMLGETADLMKSMALRGKVPLYTKGLIKIIGSTTSARQHIISNVAILDPPESTWKSREFEKLHLELQQNFDIGTRFRTLDRKLSLIQDNIEILSDLTASRKSTFLEALIVILIVGELLLAVFVKR